VIEKSPIACITACDINTNLVKYQDKSILELWFYKAYSQTTIIKILLDNVAVEASQLPHIFWQISLS